jgi:CheY-like chemotaxis protein
MDTPLRILVAEDKWVDVLLLRRAFAKAGVNPPIYFAQDGQQVMDYLLGNPPFDNPVEFPLPNLLLLDLKLPRVSGFEVLEWLRSYQGLSRLLVVVFSASGGAEDVTRAYELGANAYIIKPHEPEELVRIVERLQRYWLNIHAEPDQVLPAPVLMAG